MPMENNAYDCVLTAFYIDAIMLRGKFAKL